MTDSVRLKWLLTESDVRAGAETEALPLLSVSISWGVRRREASDRITRAASEDLSNYKLCRAGDLVINRMRAFQGALGIAPEDGVVSPDYAVLRVDPTVDKRWLNYFLTSGFTVAMMASLVRGIGGTEAGNVRTPRLNISDLRSMTAPLVSADEQRAIADYLSRETARIDTLIEEQQRLIEMLRERRAAVLSAAFDIGPSTEATKVGRLLAARPSYGVLVPRYVDEAEGVPFVRVGDLLNLAPERPMLAIAPEQSEEYSRTKIVGGEVLLGVVGKMGQAALAPRWLAGANVARAVAVLRCKDPAVAPLLCAWLGSNNFLYQAELATSGDSIQPTLGMKDLSGFDINLPTDPNAAADLARRLAKIDALIVETERFIELARERRAALITAAVTGQIDVRKMA
jgi:type I restriction enzyme S subunit